MMKGGGDSKSMGKKDNGCSACRIWALQLCYQFTAGHIVEILSGNDEDEGDHGVYLDGGISKAWPLCKCNVKCNVWKRV